MPRRRAIGTSILEQAKARGEIPKDANTSLLIDIFYGFSLYRLLTGQIDDDGAAENAAIILAETARISAPISKGKGTIRAKGEKTRGERSVRKESKHARKRPNDRSEK